MFYVYTLIDPRDGAVFYVGKGKGNRLDHHEREARQGKRSRKCDRIRSIWEAGAQVAKRIVERFTNEDEAFEREINLIAEIGLTQLTNVLPGGQGRSPPGALTAEQIKARYRERRLLPRIEALAKRFSGAAVFPNEHDGHQLGEVFVSALRSLVGEREPTAWKAVDPKPFTVLGRTIEGPSPLQVLLEIASSPSAERGNRMDAINSAASYCRPL